MAVVTRGVEGTPIYMKSVGKTWSVCNGRTILLECIKILWEGSMGEVLNAREQRRYCKAVEGAYQRLLDAPLVRFPIARRDIDAPETQGVYIIYGDYNSVLHVGKSARGKKGLLQRLRNHWDGKSSFVGTYLKRDPTALREGFKFRYLEIDDSRSRALLEMYATAKLCPLHLGLNDRPKEE